MSGFLKQPLLHFLVIGALLFLLYQQQAPADAEAVESSADDSVIVVDRNALLDYMQYQAMNFDAAVFTERLDAMSAAERSQLVASYVREEALYREALRMHMDEGDYIIKQRLVQKVEFLLENLVADDIEPSEEQLKAFFAEHQDEYHVDPVYSFTHIFFDREQAGPEMAKQRASELLAESSGIAFADAAQHGDPFPFLQNYVERTRSFVTNNFSAGFVAELDALQPSSSQWQGPIESRYGYHLVLLTARSAAATPTLAEVRERVLDDYRYQALLNNREAAEKEVIDGYELRLDLESGP